MKAFDELVYSGHCATGRKNVVVNDDNIVGSDGIAMNFNNVRAILFGILHADGVGRELAGFASRNETAPIS